MRVLALLLVLGGVAHAADEFELPPITRTVFDNGLRVVVAEQRELPLVGFYLLIGAGAAQDPAGDEGLAALTAATLTRGTVEHSAEELAEKIESLGGSLQASAGTDGTVVVGEFLAKDYVAGLDLLRQVMREPALESDEVRRAREEQEAEIVAALERPATIADVCFAGFLYGAHPYGRPVTGHVGSVTTLKRDDVYNFYARFYRPNNAILVLVGRVEPQEAIDRLRQAFGTWEARPDAIPSRAGAPASVPRRRILLVDKPNATQAQIRLGNVAMERANPDYLAATVGNTILGGGFTSRLIEELRVKRSLTYGAWSQFVARLTGGDFQLGTFTKNETTVETLGVTFDVLDGFRKAPPQAKELEKARAYLRGQFALKLERPEDLAARLADVEFYGLPADELATYRGRVAAVTSDQVEAVVRRYMAASDAVAVVVVGKADDIRVPLEVKYGPIVMTPAESCWTLYGPGDYPAL